MRPRLLIINAPSPYFFYIPMGAFGLCDYLEKSDISTHIFNPALYPNKIANRLLQEQIETFAPTHIALILHWQETTDGMLHIVDQLKQAHPDTPLIVGGITAGYFGADLLVCCPEIDYLVFGDPEEPIRQLLHQVQINTIPNLVYRAQGRIITSDLRWLIDQDTLDCLSFARIEFLHDSSLYLKKINTKLGFPLLLGRGCAFNCKYCGGSRHAFSRHSHRTVPVIRSTSSILNDLHLLKETTDILYICYENTTDQIISLFNGIAEDPQLRSRFTMHYGAWHLPDDKFIQAYNNAFTLKKTKPIFEFSPEVVSDISRRIIKGKASYDLAPLLESCRNLSMALEQQVRIELFFSRYHPTENSFSLMIKEIKDIYLLKHSLFMEKFHTVRICYDHLSTDVASTYWSEYQTNTPDFTEFLEAKRSIDKGTRYPFPVDNLCFYTPAELSGSELVVIEALAQCLEEMERYCHELFHTLFELSGTCWIDALQTVLPGHIRNNPANFFSSIPFSHLLPDMAEAFLEKEKYAQRFSFLKDLIIFSLTKRQRVHKGADHDQGSHLIPFYRLDKDRYAIHQHDYLDLDRFLARLRKAGQESLSYERTVYLYLEEEVIALPHRTYRATLGFFEKGGTKEAYENYLKEQVKLPSVGRHLELMEELVENRVLLPA